MGNSSTMKEADYYHVATKGVVACDLCPHGCHIPLNHRGICKSRINISGRLYSEVYGHPCSLAIDPVEKKPLKHFHPGSTCLSLACTGCNFRCLNCQNFEISQVFPSDVGSEELSPADIIDLFYRYQTPDMLSIAYTYTEPLTYLEYIRDIAKRAHEKGIYNILVSAGYVNRGPLSDLLPSLDAANIDLKAFDDTVYQRVCGGRLQPVLDTLAAMRDAGVWVEVTHLLIPTINDDVNMFRKMCQWLYKNGFSANPLHVDRFFPMYKMSQLYPTPISLLHEMKAVAEEEGLEKVYLGNV